MIFNLSRQQIKVLFWLVAIFSGLVVTSWWVFKYLYIDLLFDIYTPALVIAIFLSGGGDSLNPIVYYLAQYAQTFIMFFVVSVVVVKLWGLKKRKR